MAAPFASQYPPFTYFVSIWDVRCSKCAEPPDPNDGTAFDETEQLDNLTVPVGNDEGNDVIDVSNDLD